MKSRIEYLIKHYSWIQVLYRYSLSIFFRVMGLFIKKDPNLVLYNSMIGRSNYDSPKAIFDYLVSHSQYSNLKHVWAFNDPDNAEGYDGAQKIKMDSLKYFITALKAGYWITNVNIERGLKFKKKGTKYINTWHGLSFNTIGNDVPGRHDYDSRDVDLICYESEYHKKILIQALGANEKSMLPSGLPRNDELYNVTNDAILSLKKELGLPLDKKIIMYAPTWRDSDNGGKSFSIAPPINFDKWCNIIGDEYVIILRTHHLTTKLMNVTFNDFVRDFSTYPRINDLFKVTDILISDYSACMADFSILERPIICFGYDYDSYKKERGFYLDIPNELPIEFFRDSYQMLQFIKKLDFYKEAEKAKVLKQKFTNIGGNATEICVNALFNK